MLGDIVLPVFVLIIAIFVSIDVRKRTDTPGEQSAGLGLGAGQAGLQVAGGAHDDGVAAGQAPAQGTPDSPGPSPLEHQSAGTSQAASPDASRFALQNWSVRSRLVLLVCIPAVTAIVLAADRIVSSLQSAAMAHGTSAARDRAITSVALESLVLVLILALIVVLTTIVGRSMVRPLGRLQAGALDVAARRLPAAVQRISETGQADLEVEPIGVHSTDEIGRVARAFDRVHREAIRLAANEAALRGNVNAIFVNLSRRSQSLVERQIRLIDDLEQGEQDPERLSSLFQMDHLATRMRRNSENLLVLAGHEETRRWNEQLALVDVFRASLSEIEHYERVTLTVQPGIVVRGQVVSDLVHLVAELAENATSFSAVEAPVTIAGHLLSSGGALLEITDQGVGMGAEEMAHANWRLDNPPVVDVAVSRRMGLFVVARLAARHGIRIRLRSADPIGLIALVWLPDEALTCESPNAPLNLRDPARPAAEAVLIGGPQMSAGTLRSPARFAPLRTGADATDPDVPAAGPEPAAASMTAGTLQAGPVPAAGLDDETGPPADVAVLAEDAPAPEPRLPIFEAVESDWFRRGGEAVTRFGPIGEEPGGKWASALSPGWRAAEAVLEPASGGVTDAGLPRRIPRANLVPGTAAAPSPAGVQGPPTARSAAATRDRFASFQRGVRSGRAVVGGDGPGAEGGEPGEGDGALDGT